jgi:hypothetical protein
VTKLKAEFSFGSEEKMASLHMWLTPRCYFYDEMISQLQKAVRLSQFEKTLFASAEIAMSGKPGHVLNRTLIIFFEDIGYQRAETLEWIGGVIDQIDQLHKKECGGRASDLIKHPQFTTLLEELMRCVVRGSKTRIGAHMSMFAFTQDLQIPKLVIGTQREQDLCRQLLSLSSGPKADEIAQSFWRVACTASTRNELLLLSELQHFYPLCIGEWFATSRQPLPKDLLPSNSRLNTSKKVWKQPLALMALLLYQYLSPTLQRSAEVALYHCIDRERLEFTKASGESRLVLFTFVLWIARGSALQEYGVRCTDPTPEWYARQCQEHDLTDLEEVSSRRIVTVDSATIRDKHTRAGKGLNGVHWMMEFLKEYPCLSKLDLRPSHCGPVPPDQGTACYFLKYCAVVDPESSVPNQYKDKAIEAYIQLEKVNGTRGIKSSAMLKAEQMKVVSPTSSSQESSSSQVTTVPGDEPWRSAPLGQIPTSRRKKSVFMDPEYAIKGPYSPGTTLSLVKARTEAFRLLQTRIVPLPEFRTTDSGEWLFFPQIATVPVEHWRTELKTAPVLGEFKVVIRESLGFQEGLVIMRQNPLRWVEMYFWPLFRDMLRMFLLRVGDMHMKNVLVAGDHAFIIDYEESSHRVLDGVPLETLFLYKDCANQDRNTMQAGVAKYKDQIRDEVSELEILIPRIQPDLDAIGKRYGVKFPDLLANLDEVRKRL